MRTVAGLLFLSLLTACSSRTDTALGPADPDVVATWGEGEVLLLAEVDAALVALPEANRPSITALTPEWLEGFVREMVVERLLLEKSLHVDLSADRELATAMQEFERELAWQHFVQQSALPTEAIQENDVRAEFDRRNREYRGEEHRLVYHLFLRRTEERGSDQLRAELFKLAERCRAGESFGHLAREYSESESRHVDGKMGMVTKGDLPGTLAEIVFALPVLEPSEPLLTAEGGHLFWVELAVEEERPSFEDARGSLEEMMTRERAAEALGEAAERLPKPNDYFVATPQELSGLLANGDPRSIVLRHGGYQVLLGQLVRGSEQSSGPGDSEAMAQSRLRQLDLRERRRQQAVSEGYFEQRETRALLDEHRSRETVRILRRRQLETLPSMEELEAFFADEAGRFASPLSFRFERLVIPLRGSAVDNTIMAELEAAAEDLAGGSPDLDALAAEFGGEIDETGWITMKQLLAGGRPPAGLVSQLRAGEHSAPYRHGGTLELVRVLERREPKSPAFEAVVAEVRRAFLASRGQVLYQRWIEELASEADLEIRSDRLVALGAATWKEEPGR